MACTQMIDEPLFSDDDDETSNDQPVGYVEFDVKGITKKRAILREENIVGRAADKGANIIIDDPTVSSAHARITATSRNTFFITDLKSTNGTQVDQVRLSEPYRQYGLRDGAIIYFGKVRAKFSMVDAMPIAAGVPLPTAPTFVFAESHVDRSPRASVETLLKMTAPIDAACKLTCPLPSRETSSISLLTEQLQTNPLYSSTPKKTTSRFDSDDVYRLMVEQASKPRPDILIRPETPKSKDIYDLESSPGSSPIKKGHHVDPSPSEISSSNGKMRVHQRTVLKPLSLEMCNVAANHGIPSKEMRQGEGENDVNGRYCGSTHHTDVSFDMVQQHSTRKGQQKHLLRSLTSPRSSTSKGHSHRRRSPEDDEYKCSCSSGVRNSEAQPPRRSSRLASSERRIVDYSVFLDFVDSDDSKESYQSEGLESDDDVPLAVVKKYMKRSGDEKASQTCPSSDKRRGCTRKKERPPNGTVETPKRAPNERKRIQIGRNNFKQNGDSSPLDVSQGRISANRTSATGKLRLRKAS